MAYWGNWTYGSCAGRVGFDTGLGMNDSTFWYCPTGYYNTSGGTVWDQNNTMGWWYQVDSGVDTNGEQSVLIDTGAANPCCIDTSYNRYHDRLYGRQRTLYIKYYVYDVDYTGAGCSTAEAWIAIPARPYAKPNTPSIGTNTRNSDGNNTISFSSVYTDSYGAKPIDGYYIERSTDGGGWVQIATTAWSATSYRDTTTLPDHSYRYRVRTHNSSGYSDYSAASNTTYNTPSAPWGLVAVKQSESEVIVRCNNASFTASALEMQRSVDAGTTWATIGTVVGSNVGYYDDTAVPSGQASVIYRARNTCGSLVSAWSEPSNSVALLQKPSPPTIVSTQTVVSLADGTTRLVWRHNPLDTTLQTKYQLQWSKDGGTTWVDTGAVTSSLQYYDLSLSSVPSGSTVQWKVKTWGAYVTGSDYSSVASFLAVTPPTAIITNPAIDDTDIHDVPLIVVWGYTDAAGYTQASVLVEVKSASGEVLHSGTVEGSGNSYTATGFIPQDDASYSIVLTARSTSSLIASYVRRFGTDYIAPEQPVAEIAIDDERASVELTILQGESNRNFIDALVINGTARQASEPSVAVPVAINVLTGVVTFTASDADGNSSYSTLDMGSNYAASLPSGERDAITVVDDAATLIQNIDKVASYDGEAILDSFISTTGELTDGAEVYCILATRYVYDLAGTVSRIYERIEEEDDDDNVTVTYRMGYIIAASWLNSASFAAPSYKLVRRRNGVDTVLGTYTGLRTSLSQEVADLEYSDRLYVRLYIDGILCNTREVALTYFDNSANCHPALPTNCGERVI